MMRTLSQVLTEEYSEHGIHVANIVIDGLIDSPGTRTLPKAQINPDAIINPIKITNAKFAEGFIKLQNIKLIKIMNCMTTIQPRR